MRLLGFLWLAFSTPLVCSETKMLKFYGSFTARFYPEPVDDCFQFCLKNATCFAVAYFISYACWPFYLSPGGFSMTIEEDKELEGIVGVKMDFPDDTCPANYTDVNFVMTAPDGEQLRWLKVKSETQWKWEFYTCKEGLKRLDRGDKIVCAKFINATGITKAEAISQCQRELGHPSYIGITTMMGLIGVHSIEESKWMRDEAAKHTPTGDESLFYWVDGAREGTCESTDSFDKKNLFRWGDWLTVGTGALTEENTELSCTEDGVPKSCLVVMSEIPNRSQVLSDANCEETKQIAGAFCGTV